MPRPGHNEIKAVCVVLNKVGKGGGVTTEFV